MVTTRRSCYGFLTFLLGLYFGERAWSCRRGFVTTDECRMTNARRRFVSASSRSGAPSQWSTGRHYQGWALRGAGAHPYPEPPAHPHRARSLVSFARRGLSRGRDHSSSMIRSVRVAREAIDRALRADGIGKGATAHPSEGNAPAGERGDAGQPCHQWSAGALHPSFAARKYPSISKLRAVRASCASRDSCSRAAALSSAPTESRMSAP